RSKQVMIDEDKKIIIYDFQLIGSNPRRQVGPDEYVDISMKITLNNKQLIMANDISGAFLMTKHDGRFVKAYVTPVPTHDGNFAALGNTHWGTCIRSPFQ